MEPNLTLLWTKTLPMFSSQPIVCGTPSSTCIGPLNYSPPNTVTLPFASVLIPVGGCTITGTVTASAPGSYLNTTSALFAGNSSAPPASAILTVAPNLITSSYSTAVVGPGPGSTAVVGEPIFDTATISGGINPTGFITFTAFLNDNTCVSTPAFTSIVPVTGNGTYLSALFAPSSSGNYFWVASYSGDANNPMVATGCGDANEISLISLASPTLITSAFATAVVGEPIFDTATLSGGNNPTGTITFNLYNTLASCEAVPPSPIQTYTVNVHGNGTYLSPNFIPTLSGTYYWTASYSGDSNNNAVPLPLNACGADNEISIVSPGPSAQLSLITSAYSPAVVGMPIFDTATLSGGNNPTGAITFMLFDNLASCPASPIQTFLVTANGNGTYLSPAVIPTASGIYYWTASYSGDVNNSPIAAVCGADNEISIVSPSPSAQLSLISSATPTGVVAAPKF